MHVLPTPAQPPLPIPPKVPRPLLEHRRDAAAAGLVGVRHPPKAVASVRLLDRATFGWTLADQEQIDLVGREAWLEAQLDPESIDDFGLDDAIRESLPSLDMSPFERLVAYADDEQTPYFELVLATLYRAVYSPRQLYERMVTFWSDHLHVSIHADESIWLKATDDRDVVRRHALGSVRELLRASMRSPAMLAYLTNDSNVEGHPNENYARELLELHTLGVDGGYTERDVKELARCLTGWGFHDFESGVDAGRFTVFTDRHDFGEKTVLGLRVPAGGVETIAAVEAEVDRVLDHLLAQPSTARFLATKMLRFVWGEQPMAPDVDAVAAVYEATDGDIPSMVRECLRPERLAAAPTKLKRPFHLLVSALRALFASLENPYPTLEALDEAGHLPFDWGPPNGAPDAAAYWSGLLLPRWNWAARVALDPSVGVVLPDDLEAALREPAGWVDLADALLTGGRLDRTDRRTLHRVVRGADRRRDPAALRLALAVALSSPSFQHS